MVECAAFIETPVKRVWLPQRLCCVIEYARWSVSCICKTSPPSESMMAVITASLRPVWMTDGVGYVGSHLGLCSRLVEDVHQP